jgi:hypothetical protein
METDVGALSASELAELAGATKAQIERLVGLGVLVARDGAGPFRAADVAKVRLAVACERAGSVDHRGLPRGQRSAGELVGMRLAPATRAGRCPPRPGVGYPREHKATQPSGPVVNTGKPYHSRSRRWNSAGGCGITITPILSL